MPEKPMTSAQEARAATRELHEAIKDARALLKDVTAAREQAVELLRLFKRETMEQTANAVLGQAEQVAQEAAGEFMQLLNKVLRIAEARVDQDATAFAKWVEGMQTMKVRDRRGRLLEIGGIESAIPKRGAK